MYIPKEMAICQQSIQKKQKENGNHDYMPCCPFGTCSVSSSTRSSSEKFRELQSEYNSVNDHIMQFLGWSGQDRKKSFIMHETLNVDNI